ncbi:type II toxin-antitoxin system Rv0910 family toxin [Glycomyces terrestris]|uniref:SRPBCC family protein n=1 Tax=Glycomyces terrestris TaxID=2493553 RepID=A0A426USW1_9ACTN|nr:SRPBCC family protein [Glycomyces terrestris]RRR96778.1 SRPBCC family protein [Glycomyces terrestris]
MRTVEVSATCSASPEKVWEVMADPFRWAEWLTIHKSWKSAVPAQLSPGDSATAAARVMNMPVAIDWTFDRVEAPNVIEMSGLTRAGVNLKLVIGIADMGAASKVDLSVNVDGGMIDGPMGGVFQGSLTGALNTSLRNVEALVA